MSSSKCCFLTCIQVSQEAGQVVWYSHLFQNFPQFVMIHTVQCFGIVNKAEIDVFLELSCFFDDPAYVGNLISGSSAFSKTNLSIWKFMVHLLLLAWRILSITLLACEMSAILQQIEHSLALPFFGIGMKTNLFHSCGHCYSPYLLAYLVQHFHSIIFQDLKQLNWNSITSISFVHSDAS